MDAKATHSTLEELAFTQDLDPDQLSRIAEIVTPVEWGAGQTVFREGDLDPSLYIVESGGVAIEVTVPGRGRVIILTVGPGEVFGWSSMFQQRPKTASARASSPTRALALDADRLRELCDTDPKLGYVLRAASWRWLLNG